MPQPRKSAEVHQLQGTYRNDRHGPIPRPEEQPLPADPPASLEAEHHEAWRDIHAAAGERLTWCDLILVEIAARLLTTVRRPDAKAAHLANLLRCLAMMQIDPAHRRALVDKANGNEFDQF